MKTITALTVQKRNPKRVNLYLDGNFAFGLAATVAAGLSVGQSLSPEQVAELRQQDTFEKAKQSAVRFISYRPRSITEVQRNLQGKAFDMPVIEAVTAHLQSVGLLDDEAFTRYWIEQRETFKPRSRRALRQELMQKGVNRRLIERALTEVDETEAARRAALKRAKRWSNLPEEAFRKKLGRYLQRRGFGYEIIREIADQIWNKISTDTDAIS